MPKKTNNISEGQIQHDCFKLLVNNGFLVLRVNSGSFGPSRRYSCVKWQILNDEEQTTGTSDILACSPDGKFIAIEIKTESGKQSKQQKKFAKSVRSKNGIYLVISSTEQLKSELGLHE